MTNDEVRWQVVKALLDEFPSLKERVKKYLKTPAQAFENPSETENKN